MELRELADRLAAMFRPEAFDEQDGWDFVLGPGGKEALLARATEGFAATFNGLLLDPTPVGGPPATVERAYLMVFPEPALLDRVLDVERGRGAVVLTHHVADATEAAGFVAIPTGRLDELRAGRVALYVLHAPLDCHPEISTSGAIADGLGLRRVGTFAPYVNGDAGVVAEVVGEPEPFGAFAERVRALCELPRLAAVQIRHMGRPVRRVAIVAGGGDDVEMLTEAEALGADTYLTGTWWTPQPSEWADGSRERLRSALPGLGMNLLGASHDASELVVLRDRVAPLLAEWGLEVETLRRDDHWR